MPPENTPEGWSFVERAERLDLGLWMWSEAARDYVARPPKVLVDRLQDIISNPAYQDDLITLWNSLNAANRTRLRNGLIRLLGGQRFRAAGEPVEFR